MPFTTKSIKKNARETIFSNIVPTIFCSTLLLFTFFILNFSASLFSFAELYLVGNIVFILLLIFVFSPLILGLLRLFNRITYEIEDNPIIIFHYFSSGKLYIKSLKFLFTLLLKILTRGIIVFMPSIIVKILTLDKIYTRFDISIPLWRGYLDSLYSGLFTLGFILLFFYLIKFYLAPALFVFDDNIDIAEAFLMSSVISKKTSVDFIYLVSSFIGWFFVSLFFIPLIFTIPYFSLSFITHSKHAINEYNRHIEMTRQNEFNNYFEGI